MARGRFKPTFFVKDYQRVVVDRGLCRLHERPYRSMIRGLDFSSLGIRIALFLARMRVMVECLSMGELHFTRTKALDLSVTHIASQHALCPDETLDAANSLGYAHPAIGGEPVIMSTDFVVEDATTAVPTLRAFSVKREQDLDERVLEKLEIERLVWKRRQVQYEVFLDTACDPVLVRNVQLTLPRYEIAKLPCDEATSALAIKVLERNALDGSTPLGAVCRECDATLTLTAGTGLAVAYHAIARCYWPVDLRRPISFRAPLSVLANQ